jgi:antitoxin HigA-1
MDIGRLRNGEIGTARDVPRRAALLRTARDAIGMKETPVKLKSSIITTSRRKPPVPGAMLPLVTPGEILLEEFLKPMGLSQNALARSIHVPPRRINEIVLGQRAVTADTDLRLARYFGLSEGFFLGLQSDHDLRARKREIGADLESIRPKAA